MPRLPTPLLAQKTHTGYENAFGNQPYVFGGGALALVDKSVSIRHRHPQICHTLLCQEKLTKTFAFE
jgi:hypothetical protein